MESLLSSLAPPASLIALGHEWRQLSSHEIPTFPPNSEEASNWPILCAWGWLISTSDHENYLRGSPSDHSHPRVARERAIDLAYRGIIPAALAHALLGHPSPSTATEEAIPENFAHTGTSAEILTELEAIRRRHRAISPVIGVQRLIILGLRRIRFEYLQRINLWCDT